MNETLFGYHFEYTNTERFEYFNGCVSKHLKSIKVMSIVQHPTERSTFIHSQDNFYVLLVQAWPWTKNLPFIGDWGFKELHQNAATV